MGSPEVRGRPAASRTEASPDGAALAAPVVSVVVPLYRNADTVAELCRAIAATLSSTGRPWELLLVEDHSGDGTLDAAVQAASQDSRVGVLALSRNVGQHRAILVGLEAARGDWTAVLDGDLQDPPEAILELLERGSRGDVEAVFAGRLGHYESRGRLLTSRLFKLVLSLIAGVPRDAGAFFLVSRRMREAMLAQDREGAFVVAMIGLSGLPVATTPVERRARAGGGSAYTGPARLRSALRALAFALRGCLVGTRRGRPSERSELVCTRYGRAARSSSEEDP